MGRARKASTANYLFGLTQVAFVALNGIILVPLYLHQMSLALYGAWLAAGSVLAFLSIMDFGIGTVLTRQLADLLGRNDVKGYATVAFTGALSIVPVGAMMALLGAGLALAAPSWFGIAGVEGHQLTQAIVLASLAAGLGTIAQTWGALPQAVQRTVGMGVVGNASMAVWLVTTLAGLYARLGVTALGLGLLARTTVLSAGYLLVIAGHWRGMCLPRPTFAKSVLADLAKRSAPVFLSRLGGAVGQNTEPAITALVISPTAAAVLAISSRLAMVVRMVVNPIGSAVFASVSHIYSRDGVERTRETLRGLCFASGLLLAIGLGATVAFNGSVVSLWVGADKYGGEPLTWLIVLSVAAVTVTSLNMNFLQAMGQFRDTSLIDIAEMPIRLVLMIALGSWLGIEGVVIAGLVATLSLKAWAYPKLLARSLDVRYGDGVRLLLAGGQYMACTVAAALAWKRVAPTVVDWMDLCVQFGLYTLLIGAGVFGASAKARKLVAAFLAPWVAHVRKAIAR